ncbi:MAG: hypothetical protein K2X69_10130, partial [Silvanigrellaceae bacterium]|nr:hypothetical protein [Silvanigrellaceae bacterium]
MRARNIVNSNFFTFNYKETDNKHATQAVSKKTSSAFKKKITESSRKQNESLSKNRTFNQDFRARLELLSIAKGTYARENSLASIYFEALTGRAYSEKKNNKDRTLIDNVIFDLFLAVEEGDLDVLQERLDVVQEMNQNNSYAITQVAKIMANQLGKNNKVCLIKNYLLKGPSVSIKQAVIHKNLEKGRLYLKALREENIQSTEPSWAEQHKTFIHAMTLGSIVFSVFSNLYKIEKEKPCFKNSVKAKEKPSHSSNFIQQNNKNITVPPQIDEQPISTIRFVNEVQEISPHSSNFVQQNNKSITIPPQIDEQPIGTIRFVSGIDDHFRGSAIGLGRSIMVEKHRKYAEQHGYEHRGAIRSSCVTREECRIPEWHRTIETIREWLQSSPAPLNGKENWLVYVKDFHEIPHPANDVRLEDIIQEFRTSKDTNFIVAENGFSKTENNGHGEQILFVRQSPDSSQIFDKLWADRENKPFLDPNKDLESCLKTSCVFVKYTEK